MYDMQEVISLYNDKDKLDDDFEGSRKWLFAAFDKRLAAERGAAKVVARTDPGATAGEAPDLRVAGDMLWVANRVVAHDRDAYTEGPDHPRWLQRQWVRSPNA